MLLYNVTFGIDKKIETEWISWIKENYIPAMMETNLFTDYKFYKVLTHDDETSVSYSLQCFADTIELVVKYLNEFAPAIVEAHRIHFKDQHAAFNTLLDEV
jgi:hypothetical protein